MGSNETADDPKRRARKGRPHNRSTSTSEGDSDDQASSQGETSRAATSGQKRKRRSHADNVRVEVNGLTGALATRRESISKAARDPRDEPQARKPKRQADTGAAAQPSVIDFDGLSRPSMGTRARREETPEQAAERLKKMSAAVRTILECVGEDPDREGLLATPERYAKAMLSFTEGYQQNVGQLVNNAIFHEGHNELIVVKNIEIFSLCEHHLVPFTGKMHIGYIPKNQVIGISKLPRIAEMFSRRLQIQERLTKDVANAIMEVLRPQGVAVVMESSHLCMVMRGVEKTTATTITSCVLGCFERKSKTRNEFFSLIGLNKH